MTEDLKKEIIYLLENVIYLDTCPEDYETRIEAVKKELTIPVVSNNEVACCGNCHLPLDNIEMVNKIQIADKKYNPQQHDC